MICMRHQPPDVSEPAVQIAGGAREGVRDQAVEAVKAVHQELPLCMSFSEHVALVSEDHIQQLLQLILDRQEKDMPQNVFHNKLSLLKSGGL